MIVELICKERNMKKLLIFSVFLFALLSCKQGVSKKKLVKIHIRGDERISVKTPKFIEVDTPRTFVSIEARIKGKLSLKEGWSSENYGLFDWKLNDEDGVLITQDTHIEGEIAVFARTNYTTFITDNATITSFKRGKKPRGRIIIPKDIKSVGYKENDKHKAPFDGCVDLTKVDVSLARELKYLNLRGTGITSIDISNNSSLEYLNLGETEITSLDVSHNPQLVEINLVSARNMANLDVSHNKKLVDLNLTSTKITTIDLSNNPKLEKLSLESTEVKSLDISHNKELRRLALPYAKITTVDLSKNLKIDFVAFFNCLDLTSVDLSKCSKLTMLQGYAFGNTPEAVVTLPSSIETISPDAFGNKKNKYCKKVIVPNNEIKQLVLNSGYPEARIEVKP